MRTNTYGPSEFWWSESLGHYYWVRPGTFIKAIERWDGTQWTPVAQPTLDSLPWYLQKRIALSELPDDAQIAVIERSLR